MLHSFSHERAILNGKIIFFLFNYLCSYSALCQNTIFTMDGFCEDSTVKEIKIIKQNTFLDYQPPIILGTFSKSHDSHFRFSINVSKPQFLEIFFKNSSWKVFASPGDNQTFKITEEQGKKPIAFEGGLSSAANCANDLSMHVKLSGIKRPLYQKNLTLEEYSIMVDSFTSSKREFIKKWEVLHESKQKLLLTENNYEWVNLLYDPLTSGKIKYSELSESYKNSLETVSYNEDALIENSMYKNAVRNKYILSRTNVDSIQNHFSMLFKSINTNTKGITRDYLISSLVAIYANNIRKETDQSVVLEEIQKSFTIVKDMNYTTNIKLNYDKLKSLNKNITKNLLDSTFLQSYNSDQKITLRQVLANYQDKSVYIDFWASWCAPCRADLNESHRSKTSLKEKNIMIIYISIDRDEDSWKRASKDQNIREDQYLLLGTVNSEFGRFLDLKSIPRHTLLNSKHEVININAPRLNKSSFEQLIYVVKGMTEQRFTYDRN